MSVLSALAEWPDLVRNIFLTVNKNKAGIFGAWVFIRGKPWVITVDDSLLFNSSGNLIFAQLSQNKKSIWGAVLEKVWAKALGNYLKASDGAMTTAIKALTGFPTSIYQTS
jgi:hypothetical protein